MGKRQGTFGHKEHRITRQSAWMGSSGLAALSLIETTGQHTWTSARAQPARAEIAGQESIGSVAREEIPCSTLVRVTIVAGGIVGVDACVRTRQVTEKLRDRSWLPAEPGWSVRPRDA
jgi:hypothetical protein